MVSDSKCTDPVGMYLTPTSKLFRLKSGGILGTAGDDDAREVMQLLDQCKDQDDLPSKQQLADTKTEFSGLLYLPNKKLYQVDIYNHPEHPQVWAASVSELRAKFAGVGSGSPYAIGAMHHGATAQQAVKIACKLDAFCALPLQVMKPDVPKKKEPLVPRKRKKPESSSSSEEGSS
jgi:hypothetical protein